MALTAIHFLAGFIHKMAMTNRIRELRRAKDMSMEQLGLAIGTDASTINKLEKGKTRLSDRWIGPIADALQVSKGELFEAPPTTATAQQPAASQIRQLPVYGLAAGSLAGQTVMTVEPIEFAPCPPGLVTVRDAYALMVKGSSMEPRYYAGDLIFIHPHRPVRPGDHAVIQVRKDPAGETETWIKRFRGETEKDVLTEQYNPPANMNFARKYVAAVHRVLTVNELLGV